MEVQERDTHYQKILDSMQREENKLKNKQNAVLQTLQKRIQRDRDEQLAHRKTDSQTLIQRNKNVLIDIIERHQIESKRTSEFLKYALSSRSKEPGEAPLSLFKRPRPNDTSSKKGGKLPSLKGVSTDLSKNLDNETIFSSDIKSAKKRQVELNSSTKVRFPKLMNQKSLATDGNDDTLLTIDQTQDSQ